MRIVLASASPRRAELLRNAGIAYVVRPSHIGEERGEGETPAAYVQRLAEEKAAAVESKGDEVVLGADTVVVADDSVLEKPLDEADARRMLRMLSGREHEVLTGVCVRGAERRIAVVESTRVRFLELNEEDIEEYITSGEPFGKAGAYAIQGRASRFVDRVEGCYFNVVGLPVSRVWRMLREIGAL
jgi:septum formation protein